MTQSFAPNMPLTTIFSPWWWMEMPQTHPKMSAEACLNGKPSKITVVLDSVPDTNMVIKSHKTTIRQWTSTNRKVRGHGRTPLIWKLSNFRNMTLSWTSAIRQVHHQSSRRCTCILYLMLNIMMVWHKVRMVADGHLTVVLVKNVYSGIVSLHGLCTIIFLGELTFWTTDIGNAYLDAKTKEKLYIIAGPEEFRKLKGHVFLIIYRSVWSMVIQCTLAWIFCRPSQRHKLQSFQGCTRYLDAKKWRPLWVYWCLCWWSCNCCIGPSGHCVWAGGEA